jgi:benzodiazapine receptor
MNKYFKLISAVIICEGIGIMGSIFTIPSINSWYVTLNKPFFNPPNFIFGPVWTTLYFLMGVSIFLILEKKIKNKEKNNLIYLFSLQLFLNFLWTIIFFGMHLALVAFMDIVFLWVVILILIIKSYKFSKSAAFLLVPYILWVSFASLLNLFVALLN